MQRFMLILFIASELCYYLLIAQTGIVEYFSSNLFLIAPLPIGGVIGSLLVSYINIKNKNKIFIFLSVRSKRCFEPFLFIAVKRILPLYFLLYHIAKRENHLLLHLYRFQSKKPPSSYGQRLLLN